MPKIFISYRREDSKWPVDRLRATLAPHVANPKDDIFVDIDNIPVGVDFVDYIGQQVAKCDLLLAVIGPRWLDIANKTGGRRLDDPKDFVRIEIAAALKRGIPVAPVLIDDSVLPHASDLPDDLQGLTRRNGAKLRRETFDSDAERLIAGLKLPRARKNKSGGWLAAGVVAATAALAAGALTAVYLTNAGRVPARTAVAEPLPEALPEATPLTPTQLVFDFDRLDTSRPPAYEIAAAPFLHAGAIPVDIEALRPDTSRMVIRNNLGFYGGQALQPTVSQNFLTQTGIGQGDCSFTLRFGKPVAAVTFRIPAIFPASPSGVTFPAWQATAFSTLGEELGAVSAALARKMADEPARDYTLRTPNFEPIAYVRFDSDFRLDGTPFAAFEAVVIERLELEPMP